jgi:hypothetical protein
MSNLSYDDAAERTVGLLRLNSEACRHLTEEQIGEERAFVKPPVVVMWCPPSGRVVASSSVEQAQAAAANLAGKQPGTVVAVYQLIGYAHVPLKPAPFVASNPDGN